MTSLLGMGLPSTHSTEGVCPGCEKGWAALLGQGEGGWHEIHYCTSHLLELLAAPLTPTPPHSTQTPGIQTLCLRLEGNGMCGYLVLEFS